jgi:hypothetical protein
VHRNKPAAKINEVDRVTVDLGIGRNDLIEVGLTARLEHGEVRNLLTIGTREIESDERRIFMTVV